MPGVTVLTAFEINNHPNDLVITIGREDEASKYAMSICRGLEHHGKILVTTKPFAETVEGAVEEVKRFLTSIHDYATKEMLEGESILAQIACLSGQVNFSQTLNPAFIEAIYKQLRANQTVSTHLMFDCDSDGNLKLK